MENLENELEETAALPRFWEGYVDDILTIIKREEAGMNLEKLNRAHRNIDFTLEMEKEGEIAFLGLKKEGILNSTSTGSRESLHMPQITIYNRAGTTFDVGQRQYFKGNERT